VTEIVGATVHNAALPNCPMRWRLILLSRNNLILQTAAALNRYAFPFGAACTP
jgi:hypothetical protein